MLVPLVNSKKEVLAASLLAIGLAAVLGTISYGFFAEAPPNARIDIFSKKNGAASNSFLPSDQVSLEAQISYKNASIAGAPVTFEVKTPNNTDFLSQTALTNSLGTANITFQIPWPSNLSVGTWQATATTQIYGQTLNHTADFDCGLLAPVVDVYTQKGGHGPNESGGTFSLNETVFVYAEIRDELNHTVASYPNPVGFEVKQPYLKIDIFRSGSINESGIASMSPGIRPDRVYIGTYEVYVSVDYNGTVLLDTLTFTTQQP